MWSIHICCTNASVSPWDSPTRWLPRSAGRFKVSVELKCRHWQCPLLHQHSCTLTRQGNPFLEDLTQRSATVSHRVTRLLCLSGYCATCLWVCLSGWILRAYNEVSLAIYPQRPVHCWEKREFNRCLLEDDLLSDWVEAPHSLLDPSPSQRKGVKRSCILRPLSLASPLKQAELVTINTSPSRSPSSGLSLALALVSPAAQT